MSVLTTLLVLATGADLFGTAEGLELTYDGRLTPVAVAGGNAAEKGFSVTWSLPRPEGGRAEGLFVTTEDAAAQPWPARFGFCPAEGGEGGPRIGYRFGDRDHTVPLPGAVSPHADRLATEREIVDGPLRLVVTGEKTVRGRDCLTVEASTNFGREKTLTVEKSTGLIVAHEETVFLGRGDRFRLTLELAEATPLDATRSAARQKVADLLRKIATAAGQGERDPGADLSAESLAAVSELVGPLADAVKETSFEPLATAIARNVGEQQVRAEGIDGLAKKAVGSPAPPFELKDLDGRPIDAATLKDKIVVLHFWEYDNDSLAAPYGQVGYLDFLHRKREKLGVAVVGIAVNPAFGDANRRGKAARSAKKLAEFMNLDYPLAADDGSLLRTFGDPRSLDAGLPLWVAIDAGGIVRTYKSGLYEVEPNDGLKELDAIVVELVKKRHKSK